MSMNTGYFMVLKIGIKIDSRILKDLFTLDLIIITLFDKKYLSSKALTELAFLGTVATKTVRIALVGHHI